MGFEESMKQLKPSVMKTIAVAAAEDDVVLKAVAQAHVRQLAIPILCGDKNKIKSLADSIKVDISKFEIINTANNLESAKAAVKLVRDGQADILMKGLLQTSDLLRAVLNSETGIRGPGILSHVGILKSPFLKRTFFLTDAAMVPYPDLETKVMLIKNALIVAKGMGIETPKVAPLAAVEVVNPKMPATVEAAALTLMNLRGQIGGCLIDGPLALDVAISEEAVKHKNIKSAVAGQADILLFHNIEAANSTLKGMVLAGDCLFGGLVVGARAPIVMTSRSDSDQSKLYSIACACSMSNK